MEKITYRKSFIAKLILEQSPIDAYQAIKDCCSKHKKVTTRVSFNKETINYGRTKIGYLKIARKNITLCLALEPSTYIVEGYSIKDISDEEKDNEYKLAIQITNQKRLKQALELLEETFKIAGATELKEGSDVDYKKKYFYRDLEQLITEGLVKKYVKKSKKIINVESKPLKFKVNFTARLMYEAKNQADNLYIITSYDDWDLSKAIKMDKHADNTFTASKEFDAYTNLEFKICRAQNWENVEKGIWKEEIVNHNYVLVDHNLEVEDLIYNFRQE